MSHDPLPPPLPPPPLSSHEPKRLSPLKWLAGVVVLVLVMIGGGGLGFYLSRGGPPTAVAPSPAGTIVMLVIGIVLFALGAAAYALVLVTGCFTLNFHKPFFKSFGVKLWVINLAVGLLLQTGVALMAAPLVYPPLLRMLAPQVALMASFFAPFIATQLVSIWLILWAPLDRIVISRRLRRGIGLEQIAAGRYVGLSNPDRSSLKKFTLVEEDYGMLWIDDGRLVYWGDVDGWEIPHDRFVAVERKADAGATSSYFGAVHVILRYLGPDGAERRVRVHSEGDWTQTGKARALNDIADRLLAWQALPRAGWVTGPQPFPVSATG